MKSDLYHPLNVATLWEELSLEGLSECSVWRMNLLACSRKDSSIFFIAVHDHVHCYRFAHPRDPNPELFDEFMVASAGGISINAIKIGMIGNEEVLVAVNDAGGVFCWFTEMFERHPLIFENASSTWGITTHNETRLLAVSANNHNITVFNLQYSIRQTEEKNGNNHEPEETRSLNSPLNECEKRVLIGHSNNVPNIDFSPCGWYLASVSIDSSCRVWNVHSGEVVWQKQFGSDWGWSVHFVSPTNFKSLPLSDVEKERFGIDYPALKKVEDFPPADNPFARTMVEAFRVSQGHSPHEIGTGDSQSEESTSEGGGVDSMMYDGDGWVTDEDDGEDEGEDDDDFSGEDYEGFDDEQEEEEDEDEEVEEEHEHEQEGEHGSEPVAQEGELADQRPTTESTEQPESAPEESPVNPEIPNAGTSGGWGLPVHLPLSFLPHFINLNNDEEYISDYDGHDSFESQIAHEIDMQDYYDGYDDEDVDGDEDQDEWMPDTWNASRSWDLEIDSDDEDDNDMDQETDNDHRDRRRRGSYGEMVTSTNQPSSSEVSLQGYDETPRSECSDVDQNHTEACPGIRVPMQDQSTTGNMRNNDVPTSSPPIITKINATKPRPINDPDIPTIPPMPIPLILCTTVHDLVLLKPDDWPPRLENPSTSKGPKVDERKGLVDAPSDENNNHEKLAGNEKEQLDGEKRPRNMVTVASEKRLVSRYDKRLRRNIAPFERLNMVEWIPELSLAIVASQKGYAALVRLIRVYPDHPQPLSDENARPTKETDKDAEKGEYIMHIESYLPIDEPPPAPLLGFFVSVHAEPTNSLNSALTSSSLPFYRVCMIYYDKSMNLYEIRKDPNRLGRLAVELLVV